MLNNLVGITVSQKKKKNHETEKNRKQKSEWRYSGAVRRTETWRTWRSRPNASAPHEALKVFLVKYKNTQTYQNIKTQIHL